MPFIGNRLASEVEATPTLLDEANVSSIVQELSNDQLSKTTKRFSRSAATPFRGTSRSQRYRKETVIGECPQGQNYYVCQANGFRGCCSKNACDSGVVCPESNESTAATIKSTSTEVQSKSATSDVAATSSHSVSAAATTASSKTESEARELKSALTSATGTPTSNATAIRATEDVASAPSCPKGNGTTYSDNNNIAYVVHCGSDNTAPSYNSVQVSIGGYAQCFSNCSTSSDCEGFTYVGLDGGVCYLKSTMPNDTYVAKAMNNYISCSKINPNASAPRPTTTATPAPGAKQPDRGAIAGGVVGGIALIGLVLFLIAFLARRRRKDLENKRATVTHVFGGAIEPGRHDDDAQTLPLHRHRNGSTSSDPFVQFGGYQRGTSSIARDYANHSNTTSPASNKGGSIMMTPKNLHPDTMPYHPPNETKASSPVPFILPSTTYQPPNHSSPESIPMLDSTPVQRSKSRSPRFHEHISELEDTSSPPPIATPNATTRRWGSVLYAARDSTTLGNPQTAATRPDVNERLDEARRRQEQLHLMSWNNYGDSRAAQIQNGGKDVGAAVRREQTHQNGNGVGGQQGEVSPDDSDSPLDRKFIISPMGTLDRPKR